MREFNVELETMKIVEFVRKYYKDNNLGGVILGISGGKDSSVVAGLFTLALGRENVIGVTMPCHSKDSDRVDAKLVSDYYGFELINFDLTNVYDSFKNELTNLGEFNDEETKNSDINLKPRLRMATLYYLAALYSSIKGKTYLVAGTSNKCELFVGYFTKGGDSVHDIAPIADLSVSEVIKLGELLDVPRDILYKEPSDGLSGVSDEDKLGVTYSDVERYMNGDMSLDEDVRLRIEKLHKTNLHKLNIPTYKKDLE
jgi:NAD+ synthase